jgi:hypothetical protein
VSDRSGYLDLIRELVKGDPEAYRARCEQLDEAGWDQLGLVVGAAFFLAARQQFGTSMDPSTAIRFVADTRAEIASTGFDLDPNVAERLLIATTTGDTTSLESLDSGLIVQSEMLLLWKLLQRLSDAEMSQFLIEVDSLADQWSRE